MILNLFLLCSSFYYNILSHTHTHNFQAELAGKKGLVPCNFLQEITPPRNDEIEVFAADEDSMKIANAIIQRVRLHLKVKGIQ